MKLCRGFGLIGALSLSMMISLIRIFVWAAFLTTCHVLHYGPLDGSKNGKKTFTFRHGLPDETWQEPSITDPLSLIDQVVLSYFGLFFFFLLGWTLNDLRMRRSSESPDADPLHSPEQESQLDENQHHRYSKYWRSILLIIVCFQNHLWES